MIRFHKSAGAILRCVQNLTLYRRLGRRTALGITIREASDKDMRAVHRWFNPGDNPSNTLTHDEAVTNWVAERHGQLAGFGQLVRHPYDHFPYTGYWLFSLSVKSLLRGLGIGEMLSQAVIERARQEGASILDLVVNENNDRAIRLYRKLGFEMHTIPELEPLLERERASTGCRRVVMRKILANHT